MMTEHAIDISKRYMVTGGSGFIGSHLVERLLAANCNVTIYDKAVNRSANWLRLYQYSDKLTIYEADLADTQLLAQAIDGQDVVFHFAAHTDTRRSGELRQADLQDGIIATTCLLEAMQQHGVGALVFASSQLVYGDLDTFPISETIGPLLPTSLYGASKLACEGIISAYSHLFDMRATICRFTNIVGSRMRQGIIYDFIRKLMHTPEHLEIKGDGKQARSYFLVNHALDALFTAYLHGQQQGCQVYNVGSLDTTTATDVGRIVIQEMGLEGIAEVSYTDGKRGWKGDTPSMQYNLARIQSLGWTPRLSSDGAVRETVRLLQKDLAEEMMLQTDPNQITLHVPPPK
jgi:UDP-glucose 4-epimerase